MILLFCCFYCGFRKLNFYKEYTYKIFVQKVLSWPLEVRAVFIWMAFLRHSREHQYAFVGFGPHLLRMANSYKFLRSFRSKRNCDGWSLKVTKWNIDPLSCLLKCQGTLFRLRYDYRHECKNDFFFRLEVLKYGECFVAHTDHGNLEVNFSAMKNLRELYINDNLLITNSVSCKFIFIVEIRRSYRKKRKSCKYAKSWVLNAFLKWHDTFLLPDVPPFELKL